MRTVIFFGLMSIASSIGKQTGWSMTEASINFTFAILLFAIVFDVVDMFRGSKP